MRYAKKTKPATWQAAFPEQKGALKPVLKDREQKPGQPRFWRRKGHQVPAAKKNRIRSETPEHAAARRAYNRRVKVWLTEHGNGWCRVSALVDLGQARGVLGLAYLPATQCHHKRGRLGPLLMAEKFWIPVSAAGHAWIDANREEARRLGLLAEKGDWHRTDDL